MLAATFWSSPLWLPPNGALHGLALDRLMKINLITIAGGLQEFAAKDDIGDPAAAAMAMLTAHGFALDQRFALELRHDWHAHPMLWALLVGRSSSGKGPLVKQALKPIYAAQARLQELNALILTRYEGAARTAEELGRAFPGVPVRTSGGPHVLATVPAEAALVIATPGAEPVAEGGYAAALFLDGWALLGRPSLRAAEETLRRWLNAAALVRASGPVVVLAEAAVPAVQALIRWDPAGFAERELAERAELGFPPAVRMAAVTGPSAAVADFVGSAGLPDRAEVLGPVPAESAPGRGADTDPAAEPQQRALIRTPRPDGIALARALHAAQATRSARKEGVALRVQLDPAEVA